ncbi:MAG: phosphoribosyltransferase regulatory subunit [Pyrococcus sp.]|uniref:ATP phosphoribosyltransferase regulatory subunit n=1 Tax=Pyrococcus sp. TaxID=33866 RepID=UPI0025889D50|nr:ATP phosphoribosyltransferase regulatory subunit [Pyrococcus sp.]MDK2869475.1 phosphoribosyltransferase regulatory subunit [Pyrococcus sp.]
MWAKRSMEEYIKIAEIANKLRSIFQLWGYKEVVFPIIEEYSPEIRKGTKFAYNNLFYLISPDVTSRILKQFKDGNAKVFYIAEVLNGDVKGEWQAGIEFIGGKGLGMYLEALSIAITSLESLGITEFYIDIGSIEVWKELSGEYWPKIKEALIKRNFEIIENIPIPKDKKDKMWELFNFRGRRSGIEKLDTIVDSIEDPRVFIDLGTVRPLPYYTDIIFEIYSPQVGKPIGGGGEYEVRGKQAIGFVFYLNRLLSLYRPKDRARKVISEIDPKKAYSTAREMVRLGIPVEVRL